MAKGKAKQAKVVEGTKLEPSLEAIETSPELVSVRPDTPKAKTSPVASPQAPSKPAFGDGVDHAGLVAARALQGMAQAESVTIEKHTEKLRYKIAYSAHKLADELATALSSKVKKDKEYVKGLVWSLGVLYDKINTGESGNIAVRIPAKLLDNVKLVIAVQAEKKAKSPVDITPPTAPALDSVSSAPSINS